MTMRQTFLEMLTCSFSDARQYVKVPMGVGVNFHLNTSSCKDRGKFESFLKVCQATPSFEFLQ